MRKFSFRHRSSKSDGDRVPYSEDPVLPVVSDPDPDVPQEVRGEPAEAVAIHRAKHRRTKRVLTDGFLRSVKSAGARMALARWYGSPAHDAASECSLMRKNHRGGPVASCSCGKCLKCYNREMQRQSRARRSRKLLARKRTTAHAVRAVLTPERALERSPERGEYEMGSPD